MTQILIVPNGFQAHYTLNLINSLAGVADRVEFVSSDMYPVAAIDQRIHCVNLRGSQDENVSCFQKMFRVVKYYLLFLKYVASKRNFAVHVQWLRFNFFDGVVVSSLLRLFGCRVFYTVHDVLPHSKDNVLNRLLFRVIYHIPHILFVHTEFIRLRLIKEFGCTPDRVKVVHHGVYDVSNSAGVTRETARQTLGVSKEDVLLLFTGAIADYKGLDVLLDAMKLYLRDDQRIKLLIAGRVKPDYEGKLRELLSGQVSERIILQLRWLSDEEIEKNYKGADITILPYKEASQSGVLFMSYGYGRPVIVSNIGGFPHDVVEGVTGYLFNQGDAKDLAGMVRRCIAELLPKGLDVERGIKLIAREKYSWATTAKDLVAHYSLQKA